MRTRTIQKDFVRASFVRKVPNVQRTCAARTNGPINAHYTYAKCSQKSTFSLSSRPYYNTYHPYQKNSLLILDSGIRILLWYTANIVTISVFNALSIGSGFSGGRAVYETGGHFLRLE